MAQDIVPELLQKIQDDFQKAVSADENIRKFLKKIRELLWHQAYLLKTFHKIKSKNLGNILKDLIIFLHESILVQIWFKN
mgnify:CR=1 FL=1